MKLLARWAKNDEADGSKYWRKMQIVCASCVQAAKWLKTRVISGQEGGALLPVPVDFRHDYIVARPKDSVIVQVPLFFRAFELDSWNATTERKVLWNHSCCQVLERNFTRRNIRLIYPSIGADPLTRRCVTRVNHYHQPSLAENHVKRPPRVIIHASLSVFLMQLHRLPISGHGVDRSEATDCTRPNDHTR